MTRRIVFAGGIQARALAKAYRLDIAADRDEDVFFIGAEAMSREAAHRVIAAGDIVITDLTPTGETVPDHLIPRSAQRIAVPVVLAPFLWPFAGRPHPLNHGIEALPDGPYPADFGDRFLDRMMQQGVPEDEAIARYLALDVEGIARLDEQLEASLASLAALDARAGFAFAGFVRREFTQQNLFATTERLRLPLFRHIASCVFERMGEPATRGEALLEVQFKAGAAPIHPAVLKHFGMAAPTADHHYPILDEGTFTFEQHCRRYIRFEWNELLHEAILLSETSPAEAVPKLRQALDISPGSRAGQQALDDAERCAVEAAAQPPLALTASSQSPANLPPPLSASSYTPLYAAVDAPLPDQPADTSLRPSGQPPVFGKANRGDPDAAPVFAPSGFGKLPFTSELPPRAPERAADTENDGTMPAYGARKMTVFAPPAKPASAPPPEPWVAEPPAVDTGVTDPGLPEMLVSDPLAEGPHAEELLDREGSQVPVQQAYVELPLNFTGNEALPVMREAPMPVQAGNRYTPLPPSADLIEVLPRMLPSTRGLTSASDSPFSMMPETMPPPPLRPVLPPELQPELEERRGLVARIFGGRK